MKNGLEIDEYGAKWYYKDNVLHRENGPAVELPNRNKYWYINGKVHRIDGPAIEYAVGDKEWVINGKCHREDGPAIECVNGDKSWYLDGEKIYCKSNEEFLKIVKYKWMI